MKFSRDCHRKGPRFRETFWDCPERFILNFTLKSLKYYNVLKVEICHMKIIDKLTKV